MSAIVQRAYYRDRLCVSRLPNQLHTPLLNLGPDGLVGLQAGDWRHKGNPVPALWELTFQLGSWTPK